MPTYLRYDASGPDYYTDPQGWCIPMNTYDPAQEWAVAAVKDIVEPELSSHLGTLSGKDAGWHAEPEADGSVIVERRFTERRGMQYHPRTWAWTVNTHPGGRAFAVANSDAAREFCQEHLT